MIVASPCRGFRAEILITRSLLGIAFKSAITIKRMIINLFGVVLHCSMVGEADADIKILQIKTLAPDKVTVQQIPLVRPVGLRGWFIPDGK